jgi:hypothetical protein
MGTRKNTFALLAVASLILGILGTMPSHSAEPNDVTLKILNGDKSANVTAVVTPTGIPQPSQRPNQKGETVWKLQAGTQSFKVEFLAGSNPGTPSTSYAVSIGIRGVVGEEHTIELPEIIETLVPVSESSNIGESYWVTWESGWRSSRILVDGAHQTVSATALPQILSLNQIDGKNFFKVAYTKPLKLSRADSQDLDGDLYPDFQLSISTRFGKAVQPILTSAGNGNQSAISLADVPWVDVKAMNEGLYLSVLYRGADITEELASGTFASRAPEMSERFLFIKGRNTEYQFRAKPYDLEGHQIVFSINNTTLALSKPLSLKTQNVICADNSKGWIRQFQTLGACPEGWTLTATLRAMSEKKYSNCASINKFLPGGIAKSGALNTGKKVFRSPLSHNPGYIKNKHLDTDKDGIACER